MTEPLVDLDGIELRLTGIPVLTAVELRAEPGEVVAIAGANGAGKTSLLGIISTLLRPSAGTGRVLGAELGTPATRTVRRRIGWSGHEAGLYPELTLIENLALHARLAGLGRDAAEETLDQVGLSAAAGRRAGHASSGMQRRVDLARLLMLSPDLVLLDEANAGLDESAEVIVDAIIDRTRRRQGSVVMVSHHAAQLDKRADRVLTLVEGRIRP